MTFSALGALPGWESLVKDLTLGVRALRGNPRFALAAIAMLGVSIGVNTAVVTLTNAALFKGYPQVQRNDRLLYLTMFEDCCVSYPVFEDWRSQAKSFQGMAAVHDSRRVYSDGDGSPRTYYATEITANTFGLAGCRPVLGRDFVHGDELPGAPLVVILSDRLWDQRYSRNPAILGRIVRLNDEPATVIGVMPRGFSFPQNQDLWVPMVATTTLANRSNSGAIWYILGRLADGATVQSARAEMQTIGRNLQAAHPRTDTALPMVRTFPEFFIRSGAIRVYQAMLGAVSFLLLIACANLANLLLARSIDRSRELSVRLALGASRWRIVRQLLVESVLLSVPGGLLGWCIAAYGIRVYAHFADGGGVSAWTGIWFANILDYSMDARVFAYLAAVSLGTGLLFGLAPALRLSRLDIHLMLRDGGRGSTGGERGKRLSTLLVMAETALTVLLLAGSGVMVRSFWKVYRADLGFDPTRILVLALNAPVRSSPAEITSFGSRLKVRLEAIPGVDSVALANSFPTRPFPQRAYEALDAPAAGPVNDPRSRPRTEWAVVTPDYFRTLGLPMLSGREFNPSDGAATPPVAIVNRQLASTIWPHQEALGKHLRLFDGNTAGPWLTVAGVAPDVAQNNFLHPGYQFAPAVYLPLAQHPLRTFWVQARTHGPPEALSLAFQRELHALDPALPIMMGPVTLSENLEQGYRYQGTSSLLFLIFAAVALLLASMGLYSVIAHSVSRRTQEIGVRIALGATVSRILRLISGQAVVPVGAGLIAGLTASAAINRLLDIFLLNVSPTDPLSLFGAAAVLLLCAALGCVIPAARAARIDPAQAIRYE